MFSNIPILLTWLRIILIPVFVVVYYLPDAWLGPVAKNWTAIRSNSAGERSPRSKRARYRFCTAPCRTTRS